jgi:hypothetical protein
MEYWSWILTSVGLLGLFLAGMKIWWAWLIGLSAQVLWIVYAIQTEQYGFIVSALAYGFVYGFNALKWRKDDTRKEAA